MEAIYSIFALMCVYAHIYIYIYKRTTVMDFSIADADV